MALSTAAATLAAGRISHAAPASAIGQSGAGQAVISQVDLRGGIDAASQGMVPGAVDQQSRRLAAIIAKAARENMPVFLPPGTYRISNLDLPDGTRLTGVAGATRLIYTGEGHLLRAEGVRRIELSNLVLDGANRWLGDYAPALLHLRGVAEVVIDNCEIAGSAKTGIQLERCGGRIERSRISGAAEHAVMAVESTGLSVTGNTVANCGNGGILVHRWTKGPDGTIVTGNRISGIRAAGGGTGQNGNGINIFRADNVLVSGNHITGAAFSAIRSNAGSNIQIADNHCLSSGETAIYSEFGFEGAVVSGNIVDGAANGISVVNFNDGGRLATITGNVVRNLSATGPYVADDAFFGTGISGEADLVISANVVENAPRSGLLLGWGPYLRNVVASGNVVRMARTGCAVSVAEGAGHAIIANNLFEKVETGGVIGFRWHDRASGELALDASAFERLTVMGNRVI